MSTRCRAASALAGPDQLPVPNRSPVVASAGERPGRTAPGARHAKADDPGHVPRPAAPPPRQSRGSGSRHVPRRQKSAAHLRVPAYASPRAAGRALVIPLHGPADPHGSCRGRYHTDRHPGTRHRQVTPRGPVRVRGTGRGAMAPLPRHQHPARSPLVSVLATLRVTPPGRPPHSHLHDWDTCPVTTGRDRARDESSLMPRIWRPARGSKQPSPAGTAIRLPAGHCDR